MLYVMTHKKIEDKRIPKDRTFLLVGAFNKDIKDYLRDDSDDDNISIKNKSYCELTGLYYIWKHSNEEIVGLEHYRRLFSKDHYLLKYKIMPKEKIESYLNDYDLILPKKHFWPNYNSLYDEFKTEHIESDLVKLEELINNEFKDYKESWDKVMHHQNYAYNYNMFVCKKELIDEYCEFLFSVLFKLEPLINLEDGRDDYQKRLFGFLSERLFNVWINKKGNLKIKELKVATLGDKITYDLKRRIYRFFKWRKLKKASNS